MRRQAYGVRLKHRPFPFLLRGQRDGCIAAFATAPAAAAAAAAAHARWSSVTLWARLEGEIARYACAWRTVTCCCSTGDVREFFFCYKKHTKSAYLLVHVILVVMANLQEPQASKLPGT